MCGMMCATVLLECATIRDRDQASSCERNTLDSIALVEDLLQVAVLTSHMYYSLNSLKGGYIGDYIGDYYRVIKGGTRSLDNGSYEP